MADREHFRLLSTGVEAWNSWRQQNGSIKPDLSGAHIDSLTLGGADLSDANLRGAFLEYTSLRKATLDGADLSEARLVVGDLSSASLCGADLGSALFQRVMLKNADFASVRLWETVFSFCNLSDARNLASSSLHGPCSMDYPTLWQSRNLDENFLRSLPLPDFLVGRLPALWANPFHKRSCFISYSSKDEEFARRLHGDLQYRGIRCWFAPEDMRGGRKIHSQIEQAIRVCDRLILVLSEHSMGSDWVVHEIKRARKREKEEGRQMLFPIALCSFDEIRDWELFDPASVTDLADEVRSYHIPDFANWTDADAYRVALDRLVRDLRVVEDA